MNYSLTSTTDTTNITASVTMFTTYTTVTMAFYGAVSTEGREVTWKEDARVAHALSPEDQRREIKRLAVEGRRQVSHRERVRFGWADAPRLPCYRANRPK